jgi:lipoprotein-anchoring transpeptidase ErfK/SrfK
MRTRAVQLAALLCGLLVASVAAQPLHRSRAPRKAIKSDARGAASKRPAELPCGNRVAFQVLLDNKGFSPGEIDGRTGPNFFHALSAFQSAHNLKATGEPDCETWQALGGDTAPSIVSYTVAEQDLSGPFQENIPKDMIAQAKLPALEYRSPLERLGEKFHVKPALLLELNPALHLKAETIVNVPATQPFDAGKRPAPDPISGETTIVVTKEDSALRATSADGTVVFFAPVTTGSQHDPLPEGDYKVKGVQWNPPFHYNPALFWDAKATDTKATIKPGPNNPVGVAWIDLDLQHYGLHGTPEPGRIGHTESHGCVRLTNWDAARVVALVKPGTPVQFR